MHVVIRLFAGYREARRQPARARPAGERHGLGRRREVWRRHPATSTGRGLAIARNGEYVDPTVPLARGDALALIPRSPTAPLGRRRVTMTGCPLSVNDALSCVRDDRCDGIVVFPGTV
ncbi:MAG: hypothetical protein Q7S25_01360, partial [Candidatus Limnocylindria bacterium]|nr:hypothetical protein [Candidatus Limnocylindria bacterium]